MNGTNLALTIAGLAIATGVIVMVVRRGGARLEYRIETTQARNNTWAYSVTRRANRDAAWEAIDAKGGFPNEAAAQAAAEEFVGGKS